VKRALLALAVATAFAPFAAQADDPVTIRFGFPAPPTSYLYTRGAMPWAEAGGVSRRIEENPRPHVMRRLP